MNAHPNINPAGDAYRHYAKAPAPGAPLIFAFHGTGGDEHQIAGLAEQILPDAGIVAPRGDVSEHGANRFFRRTGEGVYDMQDLAERTAKMAGFVRAHRALNPGAKVYGIGYSNGANILASMIFTTPELFDRVVLMHPLIPFEPAPQPGLGGSRIPGHGWPARSDLSGAVDGAARTLAQGARRQGPGVLA